MRSVSQLTRLVEVSMVNDLSDGPVRDIRIAPLGSGVRIQPYPAKSSPYPAKSQGCAPMVQLAESVGLDSPTLRNSLAQWEKFVHAEGHGATSITRGCFSFMTTASPTFRVDPYLWSSGVRPSSGAAMQDRQTRAL